MDALYPKYTITAFVSACPPEPAAAALNRYDVHMCYPIIIGESRRPSTGRCAGPQYAGNHQQGEEAIMLRPDDVVLIVIDVQDKLTRVMYQRDQMLDNLQRLIRGIQVLGVPIIVTEQYPQGLGATVPEVSQLLVSLDPLPKLSFSCCGDESFVKRLQALGRRQTLVAGIESHVCVYQSVSDLIGSGYEVQVVTDAVSSRTPENRITGFTLMTSKGAMLTSTEAALFELLKIAKGSEFKTISHIVR
jgi:nicotinamidase-related amidase